MEKTLEDVELQIIIRRPHNVYRIAPSKPVAHRDGSGRGHKPGVRGVTVARWRISPSVAMTNCQPKRCLIWSLFGNQAPSGGHSRLKDQTAGR